ncbi:hypothetical protein H6G89_07670 [Oscillatoria sp. FACHB-1407]|uniref:general stress protein n=1 Tax=Oscillatoria sp. FACHB-1407 TaxID=2692847 RepID=UPI001686D288|nr:general stress protein [Oscillatoria sp. FACHB-1407]MBD2460920.1 hypothetical protein [Oscillatoria sp. FACHB-1407]
MVDQNTATTLQRPVGVFHTQAEIQAARHTLETQGFSQDQISVVTQDSDPNPSMQQSQVGRSAIGGAIAGSVLGALVGTFFSLTSRYLSTTDGATPASSFSWVTGICVVVGLVAVGLMAALAGNNVPHTVSGGNRESLTRIYIVMLNGTAEEAYRAKEALGQPDIQV